MATRPATVRQWEEQVDGEKMNLSARHNSQLINVCPMIPFENNDLDVEKLSK